MKKKSSWRFDPKRMELDENGYPIGDVKHSNLIHRQIAYSEIYLKNRKRYTKNFNEYIVHHIDGNKENFARRNLYVCSQEEHKQIHHIQKIQRRRFRSRREIDRYFKKVPEKKIRRKREKEKYKKVNELFKKEVTNENRDYRERIGKIIKKFPNAYQRWSLKEEKVLSNLFEKGLSFSKISKKLMRQPSAIRSRLRRIEKLIN